MRRFQEIVTFLSVAFVPGISTLPASADEQNLVAAASATSAGADSFASDKDTRMAWWRDAKFGMFIHWGVYSVPAGVHQGKKIDGIGEWIMFKARIPVNQYKQYAKQFNPVKYDPDKWVRLAKNAGMKYIVITSKHHDGFALFDSKVTDWDIVDATPYGKDLLKPLAEACQKHGLKLGFYYSQAQDWCHQGGAHNDWDPTQAGDMTKYIQEIAMPQVREILSNYGELAILWWDTPYDMNQERAAMLFPLLQAQPGIITNNRLLNTKKDVGIYNGDFSTPEQRIPKQGNAERDWETCMTMNDTWGFKSTDENWKSTETLIRNLVDIASKGGNYLLNVGPTSLGEIPEPSVVRLQEIGNWMQANGESIYGTQASPTSRPDWGRITQKELPGGRTRLYLHVFQWPDDGRLPVAIQGEVQQCHLLVDNDRSFRVQSGEAGLSVLLEGSAPDPICSVVVVDVQGQMELLPE